MNIVALRSDIAWQLDALDRGVTKNRIGLPENSKDEPGDPTPEEKMATQTNPQPPSCPKCRQITE